MNNPYQIQSQIKAIQERIKQGKVKNVYPTKNKIKQLENSIKLVRERKRIDTWLAQ